MRTTVARAHPWPWAPSACTTVPAWTWWVASAAPAPRVIRACAARRTLMSVAWAPAMLHTPGTACRTPVGASTAFAELASRVSVGEGVGLGSCLFPMVADPPAPACPGPRCQTVLSPCESQPCQHGGQCRPSPGPGGALTFTCHCVPVGRGGRTRWCLWERRGQRGLVGGRGFRGEEVKAKQVSGNC